MLKCLIWRQKYTFIIFLRENKHQEIPFYAHTPQVKQGMFYGDVSRSAWLPSEGCLLVIRAFTEAGYIFENKLFKFLIEFLNQQFEKRIGNKLVWKLAEIYFLFAHQTQTRPFCMHESFKAQSFLLCNSHET